MKYKVYECEDKTTTTGKALKKLVLQGEGKQYPDKNVTMWANHPLFEEIAAGQTIDVELDVKDSKEPNPHGGFYKNKTVIDASRPVSTTNPHPTTNSPLTPNGDRLANLIEFKILPLLEQNNAGIQKLEYLIAALGDRLEFLTKGTKEIGTEDSPF